MSGRTSVRGSAKWLGWGGGEVVMIRGERSIVWARGPKEGRAL